MLEAYEKADVIFSATEKSDLIAFSFFWSEIRQKKKLFIKC
jgi:hypothetical protein